MCASILRSGWFLAVAFVASLAVAAERDTTSKSKAAVAKALPPAEQIELFAGMESGKLAVRYVAHSPAMAHVFVTNQTKKSLAVTMPSVFAGRPILAQFGVNQPGQGGNGGGTMGALGAMGMGSPQILGSINQRNPFGNSGGQGMNPGQMFNVPPGRTIDIRAPSVCLQYGRPDPRADIPYEITKLENVSKSPELRLALEDYAAGKIDPPVAQLAAWHFSNGLSLKQLAATSYAPLRMREVSQFIDAVRAKVSAAAQTAETTPVGTSSTLARRPK